jgi:hypothetical protein
MNTCSLSNYWGDQSIIANLSAVANRHMSHPRLAGAEVASAAAKLHSSIPFDLLHCIFPNGWPFSERDIAPGVLLRIH